MKAIQDKTVGLQEKALVANQQYKLGAVDMLRGSKFVLLPGKQMAETVNIKGKDVDIFYYRALMLDLHDNPVSIDKIKLSTLVKNTYGRCEKDPNTNDYIPAPKIGFKTTESGVRVPENFGDELNCGWIIRKAFVGKDSSDRPLYDGIIEKPQAFIVSDIELHWVSDFDPVTWSTKADANGDVAMKKALVLIIKPIDMPEKAKDAIK